LTLPLKANIYFDIVFSPSDPSQSDPSNICAITSTNSFRRFGLIGESLVVNSLRNWARIDLLNDPGLCRFWKEAFPVNMSQESQYILTVDDLVRSIGRGRDEVVSAFSKDELTKLPGGKWGLTSEVAKRYLSGKGVQYEFKVIAYINLKGGTGKTTSTISVATRAVQYGYKTCILDMDAQANSTLAFDEVPDEEDPIFCDVWRNPKEMVMGSIRSINDGLYILPSSLENSLLDVNLSNPGSQKKAVYGVCEVIKDNGFDLIMIDCPPSLGTAVISAICAADIIVIPVCCDDFSLTGLDFTLIEIESICDTFNLKKPDIHILLTQFDKRLNISTNAIEKISSRYPGYLVPFPIRTSSLYSKMLEKKKTVFALTAKCRAKTDYDRYVRFLLKPGGIFENGGADG
jgi:chromosome partitioning protein|tara:strand:- start:10408 stop:11613 length:1206 start_codon:yes stop_codon:yes gene_type:complete